MFSVAGNKHIYIHYKSNNNGTDMNNVRIAIAYIPQYFIHFSDYTCLDTERKCGDNLKCINYLLLCDSNWDCDDGSDEHFNICKGKLDIIYFFVMVTGIVMVDLMNTLTYVKVS